MVDYKTGKIPDLIYSPKVNARIMNDKFFQLKVGRSVGLVWLNGRRLFFVGRFYLVAWSFVFLWLSCWLVGLLISWLIDKLVS